MKTKVRLNAFILSLFFNNLMVTKRYSVPRILKIEIFLVLYSGKISIFVATIMEVVAQLVRASVCGTEGRGFETPRPPQVGGFVYASRQTHPLFFIWARSVVCSCRRASSSMAEQRTLNPQVLGSNPRGRTTST